MRTFCQTSKDLLKASAADPEAEQCYQPKGRQSLSVKRESLDVHLDGQGRDPEQAPRL